MAPNIPFTEAPTREFDRSAHYDSQESVEQVWDDGNEHAPNVEQNSDLFIFRESSESPHDEILSTPQIPSFKENISNLNSNETISAATSVLSEKRDGVQGKSLSFSDGRINFPVFRETETTNKNWRQKSHFPQSDPEETLIKHGSGVEIVLKSQQGSLLEEALKETESIIAEENQWAVVEKQLAEDLSFVSSVSEALQFQTDRNTERISQQEGAQTTSDIPTLVDSITPNLFWPTSSGSPTVTPSEAIISKELRPILTKRMVAHQPGVDTVTKRPAPQSPFAIRISTPTAYFKDEIITTYRPPTDQDTTVRKKKDPGVSSSGTDTTLSNPTLLQTKQPENISITPRREKPQQINYDADVSKTTTATTEEEKSSTSAPVSSSPRHKVNSGVTTTGLTGGILRIPGHEPEAPADLNLVHHDLSLPFLKGQGAKVVNPESAMSAEGATAVILSSVCLLFIALLAIAFFVQKQRRLRLVAKVEEGSYQPKQQQQQQYFTADDGLTSYRLQPAPFSSLQHTPVIASKFSHSLNSSTYSTPYPSPMSTPVLTSKPSFAITNVYPQCHAPRTSKPAPFVYDSSSSSYDAIMAAKILEKSKMAASCSEHSKMDANPSNQSLPSYDEVQNVKTELCISPNSSINSSRGKLFFALHYDAVKELLLLHIQQARYATSRTAGRVWVEACLLTQQNEVHTVAKSNVTTATQSPVFNSRIAFQVAMAHLDELLLRLTMYINKTTSDGDDTTLGSVIVPLHSANLSEKKTLVRNLN